MTEAGWTAEPKEEGWHWWRKPSDGLTIPYVVKVQKASSGWFVLWQHDWNYAEVLGGEFLGPLSPTDRQQGRVEGIGECKDLVDSFAEAYLLASMVAHSLSPEIHKGIAEFVSSIGGEIAKLAQQAQEAKGEY